MELSLNALEKDVYDIVLEEMRQADSMVSGEVFLDGLTNVLAEPEFAGSEDARRALRVLEEKPLLMISYPARCCTVLPSAAFRC
jgi:heat-inducible transcriptional repressor